MNSNAEIFLKKTLGEDFMESLQKVELWKPGTKSTVDHEELRTALQIVPRTIIALLIRELTPMSVGDNKKISLFVGSEAILNVSKHGPDVYSGDIIQGPEKITEFKFRALPGVGLVIMSAFELYDMENLINTPVTKTPLVEDSHVKIQRMIDERLALHDLVEKVVDKKIAAKDAVKDMILMRLTEELHKQKEGIAQVTKIAKDSAHSDEYMRGMANGLEVSNSIVNKKEPEFVEPSKKSKKYPVEEFLESRKNKLKKNEYLIKMTKGEVVQCPDCKKDIFDGQIFSSCVCFGDSGKVFIKKSEDGIKIRFGKSWDRENMEMLLEVLRRKDG